MNRFLRAFGFGLILLGIVLILVWVIGPLRAVWPWLMTLSLPFRIGVVISALGLAVLVGSLVSERIGEREAERHLLDEL